MIQSDGRLFGGDVVLDSIYMTFRYEDSILDLTHNSIYVWNIIATILILYNIKGKIILTQLQKPNLMSSLLHG